MKRALSYLLRLISLCIIFIVLFVVASSLTTPPAMTAMFTPEQASVSSALLPLVGAIFTLVLSYLALRSRWHGWGLAGALAVIFYGIYTFLSQIETLAFPRIADAFPAGAVRGFFLSGLIMAVGFCPLAVLILRKARRDPAEDRVNTRLQMPAEEWIWKLLVAAVLYVAVYFTFGYYVAWRTPGLPEFYGGTDPGSFTGQLGNVLRDTPLLFPFQLLRGLIWTGLGCLIVRMHKGAAWETILATGATFSILMGAGLLFPNPVMPPFVARAHAIELLSSNFLYGMALAALLLWRPGRLFAGQPRPAATQGT